MLYPNPKKWKIVVYTLLVILVLIFNWYIITTHR